MKMLQKICLSFSSFGCTLFLLNLKYHIEYGLFLSLLLMSIYPYGKIKINKTESIKLDIIYTFLLFSVISTIFVVYSKYPIGYFDVFYHFLSTKNIITEGKIVFQSSPSLNFVGLYLYVNALTSVSNLSLINTIRFFPIFSYLYIIFIFYIFTAKKVLPENMSFFGTLIFGLTWGVYRFSIEYRTLNIAFPAFLLVYSILLNKEKWKITILSRRWVVLLLLFILVLTISHFTTVIFLWFVLIVYMASSRRDVKIGLLYLFTSVVTFYLYLFWMSGGFHSAFTILISLIKSVLFKSEEMPPAAPQGAVGLTYGVVIFLIQWVIRGLFLISLLFYIHSFRKSAEKNYFLLVTFFIFGGMLFYSAVVGAFLNPSRNQTFFAIPYSIIYVLGLQEFIKRVLPEKQISSRKTKCPGMYLFLVVIFLLLTNTSKYPMFIVGDTKPIRGEEAIDHHYFYWIDDLDLSARDYYMGDHFNGKPHLNYSSVPLKCIYQNGNIDTNYTVYRMYYNRSRSPEYGDIQLEKFDVIYTNGEVIIVREGNWEPSV
mgnify:CR=1 FL=1